MKKQNRPIGESNIGGYTFEDPHELLVLHRSFEDLDEIFDDEETGVHNDTDRFGD